MNNCRYHRRKHPRGITLIEVMFASGIALFGLLVVVALIPLAGNEVRVGLQTDRMAALGRNAVKEFDIRGMRNPNQWSYPDGSRSGKSVFIDTPTTSRRWLVGLVDGEAKYQPEPQAYAIDPRFTTRHQNVAFPYSPNASMTMPRISLRTQQPKLSPKGDPVFTTVNQLTADQLFMARDDLVLLFPDDRTLISRPSFGTPIRKRQYRGELSWMATVVPLMSNDRFNDEYVLSIIVFSARNMSLEKANAVEAEISAVPERTCNVDLVGGGYAGGAVRLSHPIPKSVTDIDKKIYADNVLKIQINSWVMLAGSEGKHRHFGWYRVLNTGPPIVDGRTAIRQVTLQGADWDSDIATQATIMEGVVGTFEKRIRLETSSLW